MLKNIFRVLGYVKSYWGYITLSILSSLLFSVFAFFSLTLIAPFLSLLFGMMEPVTVKPEWSFDVNTIINTCLYFITQIQSTYGGMGALFFIAVLFFVSSFFSNLFRYLVMYFWTPVRNGLIKNLRDDLYQKILILPLTYFSSRKKGDMLLRMGDDTTFIEWYILNAIQALVKEPINLAIFVAALININSGLFFFTILIMPLAVFVIGKVGNSLKRNFAKGQQEMGSIGSMIEETISGIRVIKSFGMFNYVLDKFIGKNKTYTRIMNKAYRRKELANPLTEFLIAIAAMLVVWYGGNQVLDNRMDAASLILFIVLFLRLIPSAKTLANGFFDLHKGMASAKRIFEVLDADEKITEVEQPVLKNTFDKDIVFDHVLFHYAGQSERMVIDDLSLTIQKGEMIGLVGHSGAGKSTLVDLLPRFYDCVGGQIRIDGIDIKQLRIDDLRALIGIVSQHGVLFNDTIYHNIIMGMPGATLEKVIEASKVANAHEFIMELPHGYQTNIGDLGVKLSGGQRQRISIARAVLKNAPILILDEATSALDNESEKLVQEALSNMMINRTSIVIGHRLTTVQKANRIVVMNHGKIEEIGNHDTLMQKGGLYKNLVEIQSL